MSTNFSNNLADLAVNYSINVKKGDRVLISGPSLAEELFQALYKEIMKAGGHPLMLLDIEGRVELFFKYASKEQLEYVDEVQKKYINEFDCFISIDADYNPKKLSLVDPNLIRTYRSSPDRSELTKTYINRIATKELRWVGIPYPCHAYAQEASMDLFSYKDFVSETLFLDKENPVEEWKKKEVEQSRIIDYLKNIDTIQIIGENTDLTLRTKGRNWTNGCGHQNLPDGEVYTSPIEDSTNGYIRFTYPGIYSGKEIENIFLKFENGKVTEALADKGNELLEEILKIENANILGECAFGTNYGITKFTKNMLFDEKMGGTIHCALGLGFPECGSLNESPIHWDILKDMKPAGSKIITDGKTIYEEGKFLI